MTQCLKVEPQWYHAVQYLHFEAGGMSYEFNLIYPELGIMAIGEDWNRQEVPPPIASDRRIHSVVFSAPGDLSEIYCGIWNRDISDAPIEAQPRSWPGWENAVYFGNSPTLLNSLPRCR